MKKIVSFVFVALFTATMFAQNITTASAYFKTISENYSRIKDYEVDFEIKMDKKESAGKMSFMAPDLIRLDYTNPEDQVIVFNGDTLTIYLPAPSNAALQQQVTPGSTTSSATAATPQGLSLLSRYYSIQYESGQNAEPLEEGSDEMVVKFILYRKSGSEAFTSIKIAVDEKTKLIRRMQAVTTKDEEFVFDFYDYKLNVGLSDQRFIYDAPPSAINYNNFLFLE